MSDNNMPENELMIKHERLVYLVARRYFGGWANDEDILQIGRLGLLKAIRSYNAKTTKLSTYATRCIYNEIAQYLTNINREKRKIEYQYSLDEAISADNKLTLHTCIADKSTNVEGDICTEIVIQDYVNKLTGRDKEIMQMLVAGDTMTYIGEKLGISRQRVSKVVLSLKEKLKIKLGR